LKTVVLLNIFVETNDSLIYFTNILLGKDFPYKVTETIHLGDDATQ